MTITLTDEQWRKVQQFIDAGVITSVEDVIDAGLEAIGFPMPAPLDDPKPRPATAEEWKRELHEWIETHGNKDGPPLSDEAISRESIYEDRGL